MGIPFGNILLGDGLEDEAIGGVFLYSSERELTVWLLTWGLLALADIVDAVKVVLPTILLSLDRWKRLSGA